MITFILYILAFSLLFFSFLKDKEKTLKAIKISAKSFEAIMPKFLSIIIVVGFILAILNPEIISNIIGKNSGFIGILLSAIIGSVTLMPTFVAFSTGNILLNSGAGYSQVGALVSTLTLVGLMTYSLESSYIGKKAAFLRNIVAFFFSIIVALLLGVVLEII